MKPEVRIAQWLLASVFLVLGGHRLWQALHGVPTANATLAFSAGEVVLGVLIAAGWRLRAMALLAALLMLVDPRCRIRSGNSGARRSRRNCCTS